MDIIETDKMEIKEGGERNVKFTINLTSTKGNIITNHPTIKINIDTLDKKLPEEMYKLDKLKESIMDRGIEQYPNKTAAEWIRDKELILTEVGKGGSIWTFTVDPTKTITIRGYTRDQVINSLTPKKNNNTTAPNNNNAEILETTPLEVAKARELNATELKEGNARKQERIVQLRNQPALLIQNYKNKIFNSKNSDIISYVFIIGIIVIITEKYHTEQRSTLMRNSLRLENNEIFYETYTYLPILIFVYTILIITFIYFLIFSVYIIFKLDSNSVENPFIMDNNDEFKLFDYNILIQIMFISIIMFFLNLILIPASFSFVKNDKKVTDKLGNKIISEKTINEFQLYYKTFFYVVYGIVLIAVFLVYNYLK